MTKKNAAQVVAATLVAALTAGTAAAAPAVAIAEPAQGQDQVAIVAQSVGSDDAVDAAVVACPVGWESVSAIDWDYEPCNNDYVVTVYTYSGAWWTVWVDAATGIPYAIA